MQLHLHWWFEWTLELGGYCKVYHGGGEAEYRQWAYLSEL